MKTKLLFCTLMCALLNLTAVADTPKKNQTEQLTSNDFGYFIRNGQHGLEYKLGLIDELTNQADWHFVELGRIEGRTVNSVRMEVIDFTRATTSDGITTLKVTLRDRQTPLAVSLTFAAYGQTGVVGRTLTLHNRSTNHPIRITDIPSIEVVFSRDSFEYAYLECAWANERRFKTAPIGNEIIRFDSKSGRSSGERSPWLCLQNLENNNYYITQLAWSGNWYTELKRDDNKRVQAKIGEYFDNGLLTLLPGTSITLPEAVMSGGRGNMDMAANKLHRYQRQYVLPTAPQQDTMMLQFNSWFPLQQLITAENLKPLIDQAAGLGCNVFTVDAGWFTKRAWDREAGDWQTNRKTFPNGMGEVAAYTRSRGMRFGLWFEIESAGEMSDLFREHPEWMLQNNGAPVVTANRSHLDYSKPEVFQWALDQFGRLYKECGGIDWVKLDYNISVGSEFENEQGIQTGDRLHGHIEAFYRWVDTLRTTYPTLFIENCSSGGMRTDLGMARHAHTSFVSDDTSPNPSLGMAWAATLEFPPRALNHWTVGMGNHNPVIDESLPKGYWDFLFRTHFNSQTGISSLVGSWSPELRACALENIEIFKRIRWVVADADCYHLTPQPDFIDPQGWMVQQYMQEETHKGVILAYRMRGDEGCFVALLQGLDPARKYQVSVDGNKQGSYTGAQLTREGLPIHLNAEYRAAVIELN